MTLGNYLLNIATGLEVMDMSEKIFDTYINDNLDIPSSKQNHGEIFYKGYLIKVHYNIKLHCMICEL